METTSSLDQSKWEWERFPFKTYNDKVQALVRRLIGRSLVVAFGIFKYVETNDKNMWVPKLPLPHDACIRQLVKIVEQEEKRCGDEIYSDANIPVGQQAMLHLTFKDTLHKITRGFIAKQILGTMSTVQVGKNWNSHGADLGSSLCQIASILASLDNAYLQPATVADDFPVLIPQGNIQTGHKHGHHDVVYVEYMTSKLEPLPDSGGKQNYLSHGKFMKNNHGEKVAAMFDETVEEDDAPIPRPTRSHTFDFNLTYCGARLIDGECKGNATDDEKGVLVLHTLDQLALKDTALAVLTTNNGFAFYKSWLEPQTKLVKTQFDESGKFSLGPVYDIENDYGCNLPAWLTPPSFDMKAQEATETATVFVEESDVIVKAWQGLRSELRQFLHALIYSIDILTLQISLMKPEEVAQKRAAAYVNDGWDEPRFNASENPVYKSNRDIKNPDDFVYSKSLMEGDFSQQPGTSS